MAAGPPAVDRPVRRARARLLAGRGAGPPAPGRHSEPRSARARAGSAACRAASATSWSRSSSTVLLWTLPGLLALVGQRESLVREGLRGVDAGGRGGADGSDAPVRPAGRLAAAPVHDVLGRSGADRLGHRSCSSAAAWRWVRWRSRRGWPRRWARSVAAWVPSHTPLAFTVLFTCLAVVLSEMTSNTASASMIVPVAIAVSEAAGVQRHRACPRRDPRRQRRLHAAHLDAAERHRVQLRARADQAR